MEILWNDTTMTILAYFLLFSCHLRNFIAKTGDFFEDPIIYSRKKLPNFNKKIIIEKIMRKQA